MLFIKNKKEEILSYIFPIARFHSRWAELEDVDFEKAFESKKFAYKGMDISVDTKAYVKDNEYMKKDDSKEKIGEKCYFYLNKIIATCKKNNIELLLIELVINLIKIIYQEFLKINIKNRAVMNGKHILL